MTKLLATFKQLLGLAPVRTGDPAEVQLRRIELGILEMEDVLFHLNSCVMMPEAPEGPSSGQGDQGTSQAEAERDGSQITFTGIRALATVFRQLEAHPQQSILIAGHTDTSGGFELNYALARQRGLDVRYLLEGERDLWAGVCVQRQKVEDHQQILKFFATNPRWEWPCDPGDIDDVYGDKTEGALSRFIEQYNEHYAMTFANARDLGPQGWPTPLDPALTGTVKRNSRHLWPEELWRAVFDLYLEEMADALDLTVTELPAERERHLRWADERNRLVACGESFPIDEAQRDRYRSQKNRRVEVLFFDQDEVPVIDCPLVLDRAHTAAECPIWHQAHFTPVYIDPYELETVPYFLKFIYFDRVHGTFRDVPRGLRLQAYGKNAGELRTRNRYHAGVYQVQVYRPDVEQDTDHDLHFGFEAADRYVYTADTETDSEIRTVDAEAWARLSDVEKAKHHDLPAVWFSTNYWARDASDLASGDTFQRVLERDGIKPHGDATMTSDSPLVFSLDDVVLLDRAGGTQAIQDADGSNTPKALAAGSRVKILRVDPETSALRLYRTDENDPKSARIPFERNCITALVPHAKIVAFREGFYTIGRKRTAAAPNWRAGTHVVGARAAVRNDADHHAHWEMDHYNHEFGYTGDHEAHYFHQLHMDGEHPTSFYLYNVSINFIRDSRRADRGNPLPSAADVLRFVDEGVYNAMEHWNHKNYWLEEVRADAVPALRIRPFWFFEEKETFTVDIADLPSPGYGVASPAGETAAQRKTRDAAADDARDAVAGILNHACVTDARRAAFGGQARFLATVARDDFPAAKTGGSYCWSNRNGGDRPFSILKLAKSTWERNLDGVLGTGAAHREYGFRWGKFTFAHELGHATGQSDEYIKRAGGLPAFEQFYECYTMARNGNAMMYTNGSPRLHYLAYAIRYLQRRGGTAPLRDLVGERRYVARFEHDGTSLTYTRNPSRVALAAKLQDPDFRERQYRIAETPRTQVYLSLHWVGEDEASIQRFHAGQDRTYQAVLCVRPKLWIEFVDEAGLAWTAGAKETRRDLLDRSLRQLTGRYRLVGGTKDVQNIFVNVMGGFAAAETSHWNFHLRYRRDPNILNHGTELESDARVIQIGRTVGADTVRDALFNRTGGTMLAALRFLKDFADDQLDDTFTLEEI